MCYVPHHVCHWQLAANTVPFIVVAESLNIINAAHWMTANWLVQNAAKRSCKATESGGKLMG